MPEALSIGLDAVAWHELMIHCENLIKTRGGRRILDGFSIEVPAGGICALLGPSGCGKTTLLRCIAGLDHPDAGRIALAGRVVTDIAPPAGDGRSAPRPRFIPPESRGVNLVFQDLALWPHLTALDHVAFVLKVPRGARRAAARAALEAVGLAAGHDRRPGALSGGEQQRLALARSMACDPLVLLLDEPFAGLHPEIRGELAGLVRRFARGGWAACREAAGEAGSPRAVLLVTHLADEALALADRVAIFGRGHCEQAGTPAEVLARPASASAALLIGFTTCLPGEAREGDGGVETPLGVVTCPGARGRARCLLAFRPGDFAARPGGRFAGVIVAAAVKLGVPAARVRCGGAEVWVALDGELVRPGDPVRFDQVRPPSIVGG
jgi:iron(III) transport system ATP-binding protein